MPSCARRCGCRAWTPSESAASNRTSASADLPPRAQAAMDYARAQSRSGPAGAKAAWQQLRGAGIRRAGGQGDRLHRRLSPTSATACTRWWQHPTLPIERMPEQPLMRLLRPLLDRVLSRHRSRGAPVAAPPADLSLPYGALVAAFAGSPIAAALQRTLAEMWASPLLEPPLQAADVRRGLARTALRSSASSEITRALQRERAGGGHGGARPRPARRARARRHRAAAAATGARDAVVRAGGATAPRAGAARTR